ncbi:MAG: peptidylprolyl isomerase [Ignavibacteria bacterium ADurb.Bin266]|nr:MAG: peptidylprolyl isomerase [Ignavibacteria bacterium ADurb.Bin266]
MLYPQDNSILARIGDKVITAQEFKARYELTPQLFRENKKIVKELKLEFLYSLIAEKLFSKYGDEIRLDTSASVKESLEYFEEMFVRDALYKKVIRERARSKADSLLSFYLANANNVQMIYIYSDNEEEIKNIHNLIKLGVSFDSLYSELKTDRNDSLVVSVGELDRSIEDQLFPLPDGSVSNPIRMDDGWYIFKILRRYNPVLYKSKGWENDYKNSERIAIERAESEYYNIYTKEFFRDKEMRVNSKLLRIISSEIFSVLISRYSKEKSSTPYSLSIFDIPDIKKRLGSDTLNLTIVDMGYKKYSVGNLISFLRFDILSVDRIINSYIFNALSNKLRKFTEYKMLADEGYRLGLQNSDEVKEQIQMWKDNYYMQLVASDFIDSANITDQELQAYLQNNKNFRTKKVNIIQIFSESLETMEKILAEVESGKDFREIAEYYSSLNSTDNYEIESGYFSVTENREIGRIADQMKIGEIYGPVSVGNKFLIFKLIDVKEDSVKISLAANEELRRELGYLKQHKAYNNFISNLAVKYDLKIFPDALNNIQVSSLQSIAYNYLGFGGRILAVPLLNMNMEWVQDWKDKTDVIQ